MCVSAGESCQAFSGCAVVLLGQEATSLRNDRQPLEQRFALCAPSCERVAIGEPEGARQEGAFAGGQRIYAVRVAVAA